MKKRNFLAHLVLTVCVAAAMFCPGAANAVPQRPSISGFASSKTIMEESKQGKHSIAALEKMEQQMGAVLAEKAKVLGEIDTKLKDPDYRDSLSPEAETELRRKIRVQEQEYYQQREQYRETLQQAHYKNMAQLAESVQKAAAEVAKENKLDAIYNQDGSFYYNPEFDVSKLIIAKLDAAFEKENSGVNADEQSIEPANDPKKAATKPEAKKK